MNIASNVHFKIICRLLEDSKDDIIPSYKLASL